MRACGLDVWLTGQPFPQRTAAFTYTVLGVVLAQFVIGAAFAVRTMRGVFDNLSSRPEDVAMTLGCSRGQAMRKVTLPAARRGMFAAFSIAWARSLGEFGPILVFAGATRMKTEVLSTSVFLELSVGRLEAAVAVSLLMVALALTVLLAVRLMGEKL
jgi:molybdate transport system permease protein